MSFIHEKLSKRFFLSVILTAVLAFFAGALFSYFVGVNTKAAVYEKSRTVAAYLIKENIDPTVCAKAVVNTETSAEGDLLLSKIGVLKSSIIIGFFDADVYAASFFLILIFSLLLTAMTFIFLTKREKLYQNAERIISKYNDGDLSEHLPSNLEGTVYRLLRNVENLAKALSAKTESEKKTKELLRDMISDISHQIKTPIAAVNMYNDIIAAEPDNVEVVKNFTGKTRRSVERIENLIKTLLNIARLDTQNVMFKKMKYPVSEIISRSLEQLLTRAEVENKEIIVDVPDNTELLCDIDWLSQAVTNLVKNALDYTKEGGKIEIVCEQSPVMTRITVKDNGKGIYPDDLHNIFKRFYRSKHSVDTQGAGLGLPLAKSIIEGQGGVITVESVCGRGTKFTVSFLTKL